MSVDIFVLLVVYEKVNCLENVSLGFLKIRSATTY